MSENNDPQRKQSFAHGKHAAQQEQTMTLWQGLRLYPKAVAWSVLLSSTLIMEGYDLALLGSLYASPAFNRKYGVPTADGDWNVPASWQSALSNGARAGEVIGLIISGLVSERLGYRWTMVCALIAMNAIIFLFFFAANVEMLVSAEVLAGIPWGIFQTLPAAYASEVCPVVLRPYLTTYINMCWVFGQFIAAGVNRGTFQRGDEWSYRIPFAVQWAWPLPILIGILFAPESPWWHVRRGDIAGAKRALQRLTSPKDPNLDLEGTIAMIQHTNELEKSLSAGTSYADCFKGVNLRRTEIVCGVWIVQTLSGQNLMGYFAYFMVQAGLPEVNSFNLSLGQYALGVLGTMGSWFLMSTMGRRKIHLLGLSSLFTLLIITGSLSFAPSSNNAAKWAIGVMLMIFTFVYDITIGPVTYSLVSELSSTRLKAKTINLARAGYNISNIVVNVLTNYQLNDEAWNWSARSAYFWAGTCLACLVWAFFRVPEPRGRTYEELDVLFERKISARRFHKTEVDPYEGQVEVREDAAKQ
ncbi:general substrate transporter [Aspergillus cavernicola]|uniref:General substrate transporter n=1 Tax=Aspergillus cavernicola TaxID=176166 RepID=A0ABR4IFA4_9EURO